MIISFLTVFLSAKGLLAFGMYFDPEPTNVQRRRKTFISDRRLYVYALCVAFAVCSTGYFSNSGSLCHIFSGRISSLSNLPISIAAIVINAIPPAVLLAAAITDGYMKSVYRFFWWVGDIAALVALCFIGNGRAGVCTSPGFSFTLSTLPGTALFILLQYLLFARLYGLADCHAFCLCALYFAAHGYGFSEDVILMAITVFSLSIVQAARHNITRSGNLKNPVALIPYIAVSFCFSLLIFKGKGAILSAIQ